MTGLAIPALEGDQRMAVTPRIPGHAIVALAAIEMNERLASLIALIGEEELLHGKE